MKRALQVGDRVRVTRGYHRDSHEPASHQLWCAGRVSVGSVGTVKSFCQGMLQIVWDRVRSSREGLVFGVRDDDVPDWLELVDLPDDGPLRGRSEPQASIASLLADTEGAILDEQEDYSA